MDNYQPRAYIHGSKLERKVASLSEFDPEFAECLNAYREWKSKSLSVKGRDEKDIENLVDYLNEYKAQVEPIFDRRANSAQEVLQPSILEEFFEYLFCNIEAIIGVELLRKPAIGFIDLVFNPSSLHSLISVPEFTIRRKDHDFVLGAQINLTFKSSDGLAEKSANVVIPAIAIECKRYLERNMLDECSGTAEKVKKATPYCRYYVVAEFLKMDDASPELSVIDEIYILRRQKNSERLQEGFQQNPIYSDLVICLYAECLRHLKRIWWDPQSALTVGKVFNYD